MIDGAIMGRLIMRNISMYLTESNPHRFSLVFAVSVFLLALCSLMPLTFAYAQAVAPTGDGVSISPAIVESDKQLEPSTSQQFSVTIKNLNSFEQKYYISSEDIVDVIDGGTPVFADGKKTEKTGMELSSWIKLPVTEMTIGAGVSEQLNFTIEVPLGASPGSHFGSIFISVDPPEFARNGASVGYKVANIISLRVAGDATIDANIRQFSTDRFFNGSKNVDFSTRIENTGNVLIRPVGPVEVHNMLGQKVDTFIFNDEQQSAVFPGRVREFKFKWTGQGTGFGRYEAILSPVYGEDGAKKTMSTTVSFWIIPVKIILPILAGLAFVLLVTFFFVRLYIRRTLAHLSYGKTRVVGRRKGKGLSATLLLVVVMLTVTAIFMVIMLALFA